MIRVSSRVLLAVLLNGLTINASHAAACGDVIFSDITFSADLHCPTGFYALEVAADNVTIDLNGKTLSGARGMTGINVSDRSKVNIINGSIIGFSNGINATATDELTIMNNWFYDLESGVLLTAANNSYVAENQFDLIHGTGVQASNYSLGTTARDNVVTSNEFSEIVVAIGLCGVGTTHNVISDNFIFFATARGINLDNSEYNKLFDNIVIDTADAAIALHNSSFNILDGNQLDTGFIGLYLYTDPTSACIPTTITETHLNWIQNNSIGNFWWGADLGTNTTSLPKTRDNEVHDNVLYDNNTGIIFRFDAHFNDATGNTFIGTPTPVIDLGVSNTF